MKNVLITGATSGIGRELAVQLSAKGYKVGLVGRREDRLKELQKEIGDSAFIKPLDVSDFDKAEVAYQELISEMGGLDIMILNAGIGRDSRKLIWESDRQTINVNVTAFAHGINFSFQHFLDEKKSGQIVGMSSIASTLASGRAAAYTASKHFISNYMTGFRQKANRMKVDITITDIKPGFIHTEMTENNKGMFWVAPVDKAVKQMIKAIERKKNHAYITKRWRLIAWIAKSTPQFVWDRLKF